MKFELFLTDKAKQFLVDKLGADKALELRIKPSGCAGYAYNLNYVMKSKDNLIFSGIPFDILDKDKEYIQSSVIDLKKEGLSQKIVFDNPQSYNECGCGESFSIRK